MDKPPRILDLAFAVRGIPSNSKHLLVNMAKLGNSTGQCFASQETLAAMSCCSKRTIRRALEYLRDRSFITRIPNPNGSTDRYLLNFQKWGGDSGQRVRKLRPNGPLNSGQNVRQNPNMNLKMNQGGGRARIERSIGDPVASALNGIALAMSEREAKEGSYD